MTPADAEHLKRTSRPAADGFEYRIAAESRVFYLLAREAG
jgi:hypothetical protein